MIAPEREWTFGAEHELGDWDTRLGWEGYGRDPEPNICNSNGIAGDPSLRDYPFGAEINTQPTATPDGQGEQLAAFVARHPRLYISQRVGMHIHIRVPGLVEDLAALKRLARYISENAGVIPFIDPVPYPLAIEMESEEAYEGAKVWVRYIRRSHWSVVSAPRLAKQMTAATVREFFEAEQPMRADRPGITPPQPRASVNLRQLLQTDTIEFRPFFQTLDPAEVVTAAEWCRDYLRCAFENYPAHKMTAERYATALFPAVPPYLHWMERRWAATAHKRNTRLAIIRAIKQIWRGEFDNISNEPYEHLKPEWL